jgi:hypothetical protein
MSELDLTPDEAHVWQRFGCNVKALVQRVMTLEAQSVNEHLRPRYTPMADAVADEPGRIEFIMVPRNQPRNDGT